MTHPAPASSPWVVCGILALTLLAPALGGSTTVWAQATIILGTGLLLMVAPPKSSLGPLPDICFCVLAVLALAAFLPAKWFPPDDWRIALTSLGISLPQTRSAQPWLTLQSTLLFVLGLSWAYYLFNCDWSPRLRTNAWLGYAIGILVLAIALITAFATKERVPFWPRVAEFGFFPNRNQTSNVLGLGGVMIYALGLRRFQEDRKYWWAWPASLALLCWALILNYSRAGIMLFFLGAFAVHLYWWLSIKDRRRLLVTFGGLILLVALFIIDGGATLTRFVKETADFFSPSQNLRLTIYRDAFALMTKFSLLGIGLGNFPAVFSIHRHYSTADNDVIHPESDWLWMAVEMGWLAPVLLLILFGWWVKQCLPLEPGTSRLLRMAAMICGCAFAIHGVLDVSGHRIGALWPALFLASTAVHPKWNGRRLPAVQRIFQILGGFLIFVSLWWAASTFGAKTLPTSATLDQLTQKIDVASDRDDYPAVLQLASEALGIAPLDWSLYYKRGAAEAALFHSRSATKRDFSAARYLLPYWPDLCLQEGEVWIAVGEPDFAFDAWREALRRSPEKAPNLYARMFNSIKSDAALVDRWRELADGNKKCSLVFLERAGPIDFGIEAERLLGEDPGLRSFTPAELKTLFHAWYHHGDKLQLAQLLAQNPEWQKIAWRELARVYADYQDYRQAYETAARFSARPRVLQTGSHESIHSLATRFRIGGGTLNDGLRLAQEQADEGDAESALETLHVLANRGDAPREIYVYEGELWARKGEWAKAWAAIWKYAGAGE